MRRWRNHAHDGMSGSGGPTSSAFTNIVTGCGSHANAICDQIRLWTLKEIRSWLLVGFQGAQVANKAGKVQRRDREQQPPPGAGYHRQ